MYNSTVLCNRISDGDDNGHEAHCRVRTIRSNIKVLILSI